MLLDLVRDRVDLLACPETRLKLRLCTRAEAEATLKGPLTALRADAAGVPPVGPTPYVLLRADGACAYPVVDGIPILMVPEMLGAEGQRRAFDLRDPKYAEAYEEMTFYNQVATEEAENIRQSESYAIIAPVVTATPEEVASFPAPRRVWIDSVYDCAAQWDGYRHLAPIRGKRMLQLGGKGAHAVKFLLGGAAEAWSVTPMLGEARCSLALARAVGAERRLGCVVAVAEELPFADAAFDAVYSGGCVHHMVTAVALPEAARILRPGGRFAAIDPWRAPLYAIGTRLLGKREPDVYCRPLTPARVAPLKEAFGEARVVQHGTLTRYPLLALQKFGVASSLGTTWTLNRIDDAVCSLLPGLRGMGSSVALMGRK